MAIKALIFHRLTRWQEEQPAIVECSEQSAQVTADHEALFSQLKKLFQFRTGKLYGKFDTDYANAPFQNWLREHLEGKIGFEKLSLLYLQHLKEQIDKTSETFAANLLFLLEDRADGPRCYVFALDTSSGLILDNKLQLDTVDYLNTSKLELALRIDLNDWQEAHDDQPYLTLVRARGQAKIGEAFTLACGFKSSIDTDQETAALLDVLASYTQRIEPKQAAQIRQKTYDFCVEQQQLGEAVPLDELSGYLDENEPNRFADYAKQTQFAERESVRPDTRKLKHLVRISGKGNGLSLSFSSDLIQQTILFDAKSDTLTITAIPKSLKQQLIEHLKDLES